MLYMLRTKFAAKQDLLNTCTCYNMGSMFTWEMFPAYYDCTLGQSNAIMCTYEP